AQCSYFFCQNKRDSSKIVRRLSSWTSFFLHRLPFPVCFCLFTMNKQSTITNKQNICNHEYHKLQKKLFYEVFTRGGCSKMLSMHTKNVLTQSTTSCRIIFVGFFNGGVAQLARAYGSYP